MIYEPSAIAIGVFIVFVLGTIGLSFYLGSKAKSSAGYFAAHGQIPWVVNGVAFAGDYLSAASFLGICGMIAFFGYDGFLYSIGFLAGWIVALFVIAEPMKRLGKFTFADALDAKFDSRGIKAAAGVSTLVVSVFYLIPQMVGAGSLIQPLLGWEHWHGVVIVGVVVITIVVTAGMVSTTWVQFLKGSLLVIFSAVLVMMLFTRGFQVDNEGFQTIGPMSGDQIVSATIDNRKVIASEAGWREHPDVVRLERADGIGFDVFHIDAIGAPVVQRLAELQEKLKEVASGQSDQEVAEFEEVLAQIRLVQSESELILRQAQSVTKLDGSVLVDRKVLVDGAPLGVGDGQRQLRPVGTVSELPEGQTESGPLGPVSFLTTLGESEVVLWRNKKVFHENGSTTVYFQKPTAGAFVLRPGEHPKFEGIRKDDIRGRLDFLSLMLALFCGTASLPHILIRYYTVKDGAAARKSTIVGIATIGFFYILTLYIGLGAMTSGALDLTDTNMSAPLLARSLNQWLFAIISAIAFTTVLGTVSGLILASSGAVAHDLLEGVFGVEMNEHSKVRVAKIAAVIVGGVAIVLGILFKEMNVGFLVGWAFSVAASANLPALVMLLFWSRTTKQGIVASVIAGMVSSLGWILLSGETYKSVYGIDPEQAIAPFSQPGIVTIPLAFVVLIVVSLMTGKSAATR